MSQPSNVPEASAESVDRQSGAIAPESPGAEMPSTQSTSQPQPSYVKLAMRNMVRKGGKSLFHFTLTTVGLLGLLVGLAYLTR
ncbi:DUF3285 domain-containing protein [Oculatella sp. LEGE 06141]|uniref:DUF3285 domain-containing protein n=1 Tax=Oculatella sp. LEGE 06141 TaxID=1828648 RepID=UPI001D14CC45|nr:DUF3285 domain-containing protein [Oculatella sp. LEGE 06141]